VRDREHRDLARELPHARPERSLALLVERRGRLVEDQQTGPAHERARDRDELALAAGELRAALAHARVETVRKRTHEVPGRGEPKRAFDVVAGDRWIPQRDVVGDALVQHEHVLRHVADPAPPGAHVELRERYVVDAHFTRARVHEPHDQISDRRLAAA
jgi:hypothetical protein